MQNKILKWLETKPKITNIILWFNNLDKNVLKSNLTTITIITYYIFLVICSIMTRIKFPECFPI